MTAPGAVSNNKGTHLPGVPVDVPTLSDMDEEDRRIPVIAKIEKP